MSSDEGYTLEQRVGQLESKLDLLINHLSSHKSSARRAARYIRVSTGNQTLDYQLDETKRFIENRGWSLRATFKDIGISGKTTKRPGLKKMIEAARQGEFDILVVSRFDRLFRSLKNMVATVDELGSLGIDIVSVTEPIDTTSSQGKFMFHIISAFAEFERDLIAEKTRDGIASARKRGTPIGRPKVYINMIEARLLKAEGMSHRKIAKKLGVSARSIDRAFKNETVSDEKVLALRTDGKPFREIAKELGISVGTAHNIVKEHKNG